MNHWICPISVIWIATAALSLSTASWPASAQAEPVPITIAFTNDIHSHLRGEKMPHGELGGLSRIKTTFDQIRSRSTHTLVIDAGDWSEGQVYYTLGGGLEVLKAMDQLGYDAIVPGNHDWLNGPDHLLDTLREADSRAAFLGANFKLLAYPRAAEFRERIRPFIIRQIGEVKVALIGLTTAELIYDDFLLPIRIGSPFSLTKNLSKKLKRNGVDAVIVVSHNGLTLNRSILRRSPDVDLIIGAHDHALLTRPIVIPRDHRNPGWLVEAGEHGHFVGQIDLRVTPQAEAQNKNKTVELRSYRVHQMDHRVPKDPTIEALLDHFDTKIENLLGPIFSQRVGTSEIEISTLGVETQMGNLLTDAYLAETGAEIAIDHSKMVYGTIHEGPIRVVDVFNSNPAIYNPKTGKSWTIKTLPLKGGVLKTLLTLFYSSKKASQLAPLNTSGLQITFNPHFSVLWTLQTVGLPYLRARYDLFDWFRFPNWFRERLLSTHPDKLPLIGSVLINGEPLDVNRTYTVAIGGGILEAFNFINRRIPGFVPLDELHETDIEDWRALAEHIRQNSPLTPGSMQVGNRVRTLAPDLGLLYTDIDWHQVKHSDRWAVAKISAKIRNLGATPSPSGARVHILLNKFGADYSVEPQFIEIGANRILPTIQPGGTLNLDWNNIKLPQLPGGHYPVTVKIQGNFGETNNVNDEVTRYFKKK